MRLNTVLYIYYIHILSCLAESPSSTSHCRKRVEVYNNYGGFDVFLLREDAAEANMGYCQCYYKKIGDPESAEGQNHGWCFEASSNCNSCRTVEEEGCNPPRDIKNGFYKCNEAMLDGKEMYPVDTNCTAMCNNGKNTSDEVGHIIYCTRTDGTKFGWEPPENTEICQIGKPDEFCFDLSSATTIKFVCKDEDGNILPSDQVIPGGVCQPSCEGGTQVDLELNTLTCTLKNGLSLYMNADNRVINRTALQDLELCHCEEMPKKVRRFYKCNLNGGQYFKPEVGLPLGTKCQLQCETESSAYIHEFSTLICAHKDQRISWIEKNNEIVDVLTINSDELCPGCNEPDGFRNGFWVCNNTVSTLTDLYPPNTMCFPQCDSDKELNKTKHENITCMQEEKTADWSPNIIKEIADKFCTDRLCFDTSDFTQTKFECKDANGNNVPTDQVTPGVICTPSCKGGDDIISEYTLTCVVEDGEEVYKNTDNKIVRETDLTDLNLCKCKAFPKEVDKLYNCSLKGKPLPPNLFGQSPLGTECQLDCQNDISVGNNPLSHLTCAPVDPAISWIDKNNKTVDPVTLKPNELCPGCKNPDDVKNGVWNCDESKSSLTGLYHPNTVCTVQCNIDGFYSEKKTIITCLLDGKVADWTPPVDKQMIEETCKTGCKEPTQAPINGTWECEDEDIVNKLFPIGSFCSASCDDPKVDILVQDRHGSVIICMDKNDPHWDPKLTPEDLEALCSVKGKCKNCPALPAGLTYTKCVCLDYQVSKCTVKCNKPDDCQYFDVFCKLDSRTGDIKIYKEIESNSELKNTTLKEMCGIKSKCQQPHPFFDPRGVWSCTNNNCVCTHGCKKPPAVLDLPEPPETMVSVCDPAEGWKESDSLSLVNAEDWVCPNYACKWLPEVINGTYTCRNTTTSVTYEVPVPNGAECVLECEDTSVDESKIVEYKLFCYYKHYKIPQKDVYYKNIKEHKEFLAEVCLPKCPEIPIGTYECDNDKPDNIENTICTIKDCAYQDCNSLAKIQCKNTKKGLRWGTVTEGDKWTEIQNFAVIVEKACSNPPVGCLSSGLENLDDRGSWEDCQPCICPGCSNLHPLNTYCTYTCRPPKMYPPYIGMDNIPAGLNATCRGNNKWVGNGFNLNIYNENNPYCPKYCEKINLPCESCGYNCKFKKINVQGEEFLNDTQCSLNCTKSIPLSEITCNKGLWETTKRGRPLSDFQLETVCGCGKRVAEEISLSNFNCRDDRDNVVSNDAEKSPPNSMCRPKCRDKTVDLSMSKYSSVSCSCIEPASVQECTNNSWTDKNINSFKISKLQGICLTCEPPTSAKNTEWNCKGIKTTAGSWQLGTTCESKCIGNERYIGHSIECLYDEDMKRNNWTGSFPTDKDCPVINSYECTIIDCQCVTSGRCKSHDINTEIKRGNVLLVEPYSDKPMESNVSIKFTKKQNSDQLLAIFDLTPGRWVLKIDAENHFTYWTDIESEDKGQSGNGSNFKIKMDCMTAMDWIVKDKYTMAPIKSASLICAEYEQEKFVPTRSSMFLKVCGMKMFTDCLEGCNITTTNCKTRCQENYISMSNNPKMEEYCLGVAHISTTGDLSNYLSFTEHENQYMKEPRTQFLKSGMKYKCFPKNDGHNFPGNIITEYSVFNPYKIRRYEMYNISRILNLTLHFKELEILDDYPLTDGIDEKKNSRNNESSTIGKRLRITPKYKVLKYTTQYIWSKDKSEKKKRIVKKPDSIQSQISSKYADNYLENLIVGDQFTFLNEGRLANDNLKMSLVFAHWKFDFYTERKQYGTNVENDFGSGYWEDGESVEGTEVKSYFRDEFVIEVGDPYIHYQEIGKEPPTKLTETLVRLVNVYVQVFDDTCFHFCVKNPRARSIGLTGQDLRACNNKFCSPLNKENIEITVECAKDRSDYCYRDKKSHLMATGDGHTGEYRNGFGNTSQIASGNNTHIFVRTVGLHNIRCRAGDDYKDNSHYFNPDILHRRFIKENILIPCLLYKKLNRDPVRNEVLAKRNQKEIMKLSLDWSLPNPLVPNYLGLNFVMFNFKGNGVCSSYNKGKSSCDGLNPGDTKPGDYQDDPEKQLWDCGHEMKKEGTENEYYGYKQNDRCCHKEDKKHWRCHERKSEAFNNYGPETAIITNTAIDNGVKYMLVYILDTTISGRLSNAQLDLTLQYKDKKGIEQLKHIYMKREDSGLNKTRGSIYLPVCIQFNDEGWVESFKRPSNQWMSSKIQEFNLMWMKGTHGTRLRSTNCPRCLNLFCDFPIERELTEDEKYKCCQCSKDLENIMKEDFNNNDFPVPGSTSCPWIGTHTGEKGQTCSCSGESFNMEPKGKTEKLGKTSWANKGSKLYNAHLRKNMNESLGRHHRHKINHEKGGDMLSFREQFFISDVQDKLLKDEGHMDEQEVAKDVPIEDDLDSQQEVI